MCWFSREATKIGFGRPPSDPRTIGYKEYYLPQTQASALIRSIQKQEFKLIIVFRYWTEEAYFWNLGSSAWGSKGKRMNAFHRWAHFNDPRFDYRNPRDEFVDSDNVPDTWGSRITYDRNSDLTLKVTKRYQERNRKKTICRWLTPRLSGAWTGSRTRGRRGRSGLSSSLRWTSLRRSGSPSLLLVAVVTTTDLLWRLFIAILDRYVSLIKCIEY